MTRRVPLQFALAASLCVCLATAASAEEPASSGRFERIIQPIFNDNCVVCHQTGATSERLNLEQGRSFANLVAKASVGSRMARVAPGSPGDSYLVFKLEGRHLGVGGKGARMPIGGALAPADIAAVKLWIREGAKP